ncbi:hypothetical protein D3C78_903170 [compost metagenome]
MQPSRPILLGMAGLLVEHKHQIFTRLKARLDQFVDKRPYVTGHDDALRSADIDPNPHRRLDPVGAINFSFAHRFMLACTVSLLVHNSMHEKRRQNRNLTEYVRSAKRDMI